VTAQYPAAAAPANSANVILCEPERRQSCAVGPPKGTEPAAPVSYRFSVCSAIASKAPTGGRIVRAFSSRAKWRVSWRAAERAQTRGRSASSSL
jgi:hypothetical protein